MTAWHPPIPAGKLYSPDATDLGPALAMLLWCYDRIQRDGTIDVQLPSAAADIGKPYGTIKDWWRQLRGGPFFCEAIDRGRRGWVVRLAEDWIDWHVMGNNYPAQGRDVNLDENGEGPLISLEEREGGVKAASRRRQGRDISLETSAYKEDQIDHKTGRETRARDPASLDFMHEGVTTYKRLTGKRQIPPAVASQIAAAVTDIPQWELVVTAWCGKYRAENVTGMLDWYTHPEKIGQHNGAHPNGRSHTDKRPDLATRRTRERYDLDD